MREDKVAEMIKNGASRAMREVGRIKGGEVGAVEEIYATGSRVNKGE